MNRDKLIKTLLEHEENLDIDDLKNLNDYYLHDFDFLTRVDSELQELDWERGGVLSKCFKEKEVLHIRNEFFMGGNSLRGLHYKTIRVINYRGEIPGFLVTNNDESLDIRASEVDLEKCRDYIQSIIVRGSKVESSTTNKTGLWMIDSKSDVQIVSRSDHPPMQTVLIKVMGDNSTILFDSTVKRKEAQYVNIEIFGNNNKIGIDLNNFGEKSRVELRALYSAGGNKIVISGVRPDLIYADEGLDYEIK
jgi:hypothetical protein